MSLASFPLATLNVELSLERVLENVDLFNANPLKDAAEERLTRTEYTPSFTFLVVTAIDSALFD